MSYGTIAKCVSDGAFQSRVTACCAQQGEADPVTAMQSVIWPISYAADVEAAYESALLAANPNPGGDETVITDQMILSGVQANLPPSA